MATEKQKKVFGVGSKKTSLSDKIKAKLMKNKTTASMNYSKKKKAVPGTMKGKQVDTSIGPNMSKVNKPATKKPAPKKEESTGMKGKQVDTTIGPNMNANKTNKKTPMKKEEKMDRRAMGRALQKKAQKSMGFKKGGSCKSKGYKSGGAVKRDGCAVRGKTKGRMI